MRKPEILAPAGNLEKLKILVLAFLFFVNLKYFFGYG